MNKEVVSLVKRFLCNHTYRVRGGLASGFKMNGGYGLVASITRPSKEERFLMNLDMSGHTVYDIGGHRGVHALFFARAVGVTGRVITFEPNPQSVREIVGNLRLNNIDNVEVHEIALGITEGEGTLVFEKSEPGAGSIEDEIKSKILKKSGTSIIRVKIDSIDNQMTHSKLPRPTFMKIDVEGLERDVLFGARKSIETWKPEIFKEIHGIDARRKLENITSLVDFLSAYGYSIRHVESGHKITTANAVIAKEGHVYCHY